jgi:S-adenosyl-L-methionine hydrolase (adenosine-forming)
MPAVLTVTTDFGHDSAYVAAMKGVILSINPAAVIVDISHAIGPQNIAEGAFVLGEATPWFPAGTIHVAVIDPGVGTERRIIYASVGGQQYVCPDNGLLSYVCREQPPEAVIEVTNRSLFLADVSNTFHGRDIMAPVVARLSLGLPPGELGPPVNDFKLFEWPRPEARDKTVIGRVLFADSFGNLITNIRREDLPGDVDPTRFAIEAAGRRFDGIARTYAEFPPGTPAALFGSSGYLELAIVEGSAAAQLQLAVGERVHVRSES